MTQFVEQQNPKAADAGLSKTRNPKNDRSNISVRRTFCKLSWHVCGLTLSHQTPVHQHESLQNTVLPLRTKATSIGHLASRVIAVVVGIVVVEVQKEQVVVEEVARRLFCRQVSVEEISSRWLPHFWSLMVLDCTLHAHGKEKDSLWCFFTFVIAGDSLGTQKSY